MLNKNSVSETYEKIAGWFDEHRSRDLFEKPWLDKAIDYLQPSAEILDLGCGMGEPIAQYFIEKGFDITGVDSCLKLIELAKVRFPNGEFIKSDMRDLNLGKQFDLVIAWHSFFHLSQNDQRSMFQVFNNHLNVNGVLLFTSGPCEDEIWSDNGGESLYHASLSPDEYKELLKQHEFKLVEYAIFDPQCGDATIWLAIKDLL